MATVARQASSDVAFFTGEDALREVAKDDGIWNWALVGPDPNRLPLSGGGKGSIDEMRGAIGRHAHSFGLLRMTFGVGAKAKKKFMLVHASDSVGSGAFSAMERGKAMMMQPAMEQAIHKFAAIAANIHLVSQEECTIENLTEKLRSVVLGTELDIVTVENLSAAVEHHKEQHPEEEVKAQRMKAALDRVAAPRASAAVLPIEVLPSAFTSVGTAPEAAKLRRKMKLFRRGDLVEVFHAKGQVWFDDGEIAQVTQESATIHGSRVRAGSMKVIYDNASRVKWVAPQQMSEDLRPSARPRYPESLVGELSTEVHSWFYTTWDKVYMELNKGFLQWWNELENAKAGAAPKGSIYLLGLSLQEQGGCITLRSEAIDGAVYSIRTESEGEAEKWSAMLWMHAKYCEEMREYHEAKLEVSPTMQRASVGGA